jgi:hypothetical protein
MDKLSSRPLSRPFVTAPVPGVLDLSTIISKLQGNAYSSVGQWKADVEQIWVSAMQLQQKSPLVLLAARELQKQFHDQTTTLTNSPRDSWLANLSHLHQEMTVALRELIKARTRPRPKSQRAAVKRDQLYPILEELPPAHLRRHFTAFTKDELLKMTADLNSIKEDSQAAVIASLVRENELGFGWDESEPLEIDINLLRPTTLKLIRDQLDQWLGS